jgi:hypothetical protein
MKYVFQVKAKEKSSYNTPETMRIHIIQKLEAKMKHQISYSIHFS